MNDLEDSIKTYTLAAEKQLKALRSGLLIPFIMSCQDEIEEHLAEHKIYVPTDFFRWELYRGIDSDLSLHVMCARTTDYEYEELLEIANSMDSHSISWHYRKEQLITDTQVSIIFSLSNRMPEPVRALLIDIGVVRVNVSHYESVSCGV